MRWIKLAPGTIFRYEDQPYLRTSSGALSLLYFLDSELPEDAQVEPIQIIAGDGDGKLRLYDEWVVLPESTKPHQSTER